MWCLNYHEIMGINNRINELIMERLRVILEFSLPVLMGVVGWLVGTKRRKNSFLKELHDSVDMLLDKNKVLLDEVVLLRKENASLKTKIDLLARDVDMLKSENNHLQLALNISMTKFDEIKTQFDKGCS